MTLPADHRQKRVLERAKVFSSNQVIKPFLVKSVKEVKSILFFLFHEKENKESKKVYKFKVLKGYSLDLGENKSSPPDRERCFDSIGQIPPNFGWPAIDPVVRVHYKTIGTRGHFFGDFVDIESTINYSSCLEPSLCMGKRVLPMRRGYSLPHQEPNHDECFRANDVAAVVRKDKAAQPRAKNAAKSSHQRRTSANEVVSLHRCLHIPNRRVNAINRFSDNSPSTVRDAWKDRGDGSRTGDQSQTCQ
ncbi:hypothetical protein AAG906_008141 [Vitis piasezkii]